MSPGSSLNRRTYWSTPTVRAHSLLHYRDLYLYIIRGRLCALFLSKIYLQIVQEYGTLEQIDKITAMKQEFVQEMQRRLEAEQQELQKELDTVSTTDNANHVPGNRAPKFPNYGDDALGENTESPAEVAQYMENVNATGMLEEKFADVEAALQRITEGTYGICTKCENPIAEERLSANAAASECIDCAQSHA